MAKVVLYIKSIIMLMYLLKIMVGMIITMGGFVRYEDPTFTLWTVCLFPDPKNEQFAMNREEEIMSKNSHSDWSAMA